MDIKQRRASHDVTDNIDVTSSEQVAQAVIEIFSSMFNPDDCASLNINFEDFNKLYDGEYPGYHACDTFYHDKQHSLDMSLALARLIEGYQRKNKALKFDDCRVAMITALFHDAGYIREKGDPHKNGAVYTKSHVARSANFLTQYLATLNLEHYQSIASNMVHFTGYEMKPEAIKLPDPVFHKLGHLIGTADLIAQMSDQCYLQKCRDRLYPEFVIGEIAESIDAEGNKKIIYASGKDLLKKTPHFYNTEIKQRLNQLFSGAYSFAEQHFGNNNPYMKKLEGNIDELIQLIETDRIDQLSRISIEPNKQNTEDLFSAEDIKARFGD